MLRARVAVTYVMNFISINFDISTRMVGLILWRYVNIQLVFATQNKCVVYCTRLFRIEFIAKSDQRNLVTTFVVVVYLARFISLWGRIVVLSTNQT